MSEQSARDRTIWESVKRPVVKAIAVLAAVGTVAVAWAFFGDTYRSAELVVWMEMVTDADGGNLRARLIVENRGDEDATDIRIRDYSLWSMTGRLVVVAPIVQPSPDQSGTSRPPVGPPSNLVAQAEVLGPDARLDADPVSMRAATGDHTFRVLTVGYWEPGGAFEQVCVAVYATPNRGQPVPEARFRRGTAEAWEYAKNDLLSDRAARAKADLPDLLAMDRCTVGY